MRSQLALIAIAIPMIGTLAASAFAQLGAPELQALQQLGCKSGQALPPISGSVGQALAGTSMDLKHHGLASESIPPDAEPGVYQIRAYGPNGLSNSRNLMVTREPWVVVTGNESEVNPAAIAPGSIWQDECPERGRNYYRLKFERDQKYLLQTFAYALDSRARLVVSLFNPEHITIATTSATNDRDASLLLDLKANIEYTLVVHDHLFRGGSDYRYAIKLVDPTSPEIDNSSIVERWRLMANFLQNGTRGFHKPLALANLWHPRCSMIRPPAEVPTVVHDEALHSGNTPVVATLPSIVTGEWNTNDDVDLIDFECEAKEDVSIEMVSHRLGEFSDGLIVVFRVENPGQANETLHRLSENDDSPAVGNGEMRFAIKDPMFTFQAPEKGTYRLQVRSQQSLVRSSANPRYAIEIRKPNPGFVLGAHIANPIILVDQARSTSPTIGIGGSLLISVHALRFDNFAEPIELSIGGLPNGFRGGAGVMARDQNIATLSVWSSGTALTPQERREIEMVEITGSVEIGPLSISVNATPLEVTWNLLDTYRSPIAKVANSLSLAKANSAICPLTVELGPKDLDARSPIRMDVIRGQTLKIPVRVTRREGGEGVITVRLHHSPPKATTKEIKIEPKLAEGIIELLVPKDAPIGEYMFGALCESAVSVPNPDPMAKEKTKSITLQLPSSNLRVRIGDAP